MDRSSRHLRVCVVLGVALGSPILPGSAAANRPELKWDDSRGVVLETSSLTVRLDQGDQLRSPVIRSSPTSEYALTNPIVSRPSPSQLILLYKTQGPCGVTLDVRREIVLNSTSTGTALVEVFSITPSQCLSTDLEIERPFLLLPSKPASAEIAFALQNGQGRTAALTTAEVEGEYRLCNLVGDKTDPLALPLVQVAVGDERVMLCTDPTFGALFSVRGSSKDSAAATGSIRYRYACGRVPLVGTEVRAFGVWLASGNMKHHRFEDGVDAYFTLMLPDVPPGPKWLHDIAMVGYDFLSDGGQGWERDVRTLADRLKPEEKSRVALCFHGWYDALGCYCFDAAKGKMKDEWVAFERTRKVTFTQTTLKRQLRLAKDLGFRVLLYFADGLNADSGYAGFRDDWSYRNPKGERIEGWTGPDTFGTTYFRNPAHPDVHKWYNDYLRALLATYGEHLDGVVWDETFHMRIGWIATHPTPAYCDRAMFALVKSLTATMERFDPNKAFLASDCIGVPGMTDIPGYAMVADGTYQDTWCHPAAWSYGLFPNWRNTLWSCNWEPVTNFPWTRWAVRTYGVPVAISNGWGDDRGWSELQPWEQDRILNLFRERLKHEKRVRFLKEDPSGLLAAAPHRPAPGDPLPTPEPNQVNWALASHGSKAMASSEDDFKGGRYPAAGVIDGIRNDEGWGAGHGWASKNGQPLPQWLQVDFGRNRFVREFVLITYQHENSRETAGKWGIANYCIEVWDEQMNAWKVVVTENRGLAVKVRLYRLARPVRTDKIRLVISDVAPLDGQARVLQLEAWGQTEELKTP